MPFSFSFGYKFFFTQSTINDGFFWFLVNICHVLLEVVLRHTFSVTLATLEPENFVVDDVNVNSEVADVTKFKAANIASHTLQLFMD